jgi:hypothetical protein
LSGSDLDTPVNAPAADTLTAPEKAEAECRAVIEDEHIVDGELARYEADGIMDESSPEFEDLDLLRYWEVYSMFASGRF